MFTDVAEWGMDHVGIIVCMCSAVSSLICNGVNSIQTCNVALCKPKKCQGMSFMFQPVSFHVSTILGLVASTSTTHVKNNAVHLQL